MLNKFSGGAPNEQLIMITVPHAKCEFPPDHECDIAATKLATELAGSLNNRYRMIRTFTGTINRTSIDLNRVESYDTTYRYDIRKQLAEYINSYPQSHIIYIFDCHSFPDGNYFANVRVTNPDLAILFDDCSQLTFMEELTDTLKEYGIKVTKHIGRDNNIIDEFNHYNIILRDYFIVAILLELNESISDAKLKLIGRAINKWINTINKYIIERPNTS